MKILFIHSYYQQRGGEDAVFEQEYELLKSVQDVKSIRFHNMAGWRGGVQFFFSIWNFSVARKVKKIILEFKPDIVQIHNWHYATGPVVIRTAKKMRARVVVNVQNYRLLCPSASLLYKGELFTSSIESGGFPWKAVRFRIYHNSFLQTFWLAFVVYIHKKMGTWGKVDQYITPTETVKNLFTHYKSYLDIPSRKFVVKPNFSIQTGLLPVKRDKHFLFVGRLSDEKGIRILLEGFKNSPYELLIAGDGPLRNVIEETCLGHPNIKYCGNLDKTEVKKAMTRCTALIFSSIWYEPFGLVITEAFSNGCPLIASDIGSPAELVQEGVTGIHFKSNDKSSLRGCLDYWQNLGETKQEDFRKNCILNYEKYYTPERNREKLLSIYQNIIISKQGSS